MALKGLGCDVGSATVKLVEVEKQGGTFVPVRAVAIPVDASGSFDGAALRGALTQAGIKTKAAVVGLSGKDLVVKYQQVPPVADFQLRKIVEFELAELKKQSGDELASDFNLMPVSADLTSDDIVVLALTREQNIVERSAVLASAGLSAKSFTPNALGLFHAFRIFGPATTGSH